MTSGSVLRVALLVVPVVLLVSVPSAVVTWIGPQSTAELQTGTTAAPGTPQAPEPPATVAAPMPPPDSLIHALANGTDAGQNVTTLSFLNDSVQPGPFAPSQQISVSAVAFDPTLDQIYVAGGAPQSVNDSALPPFLSVVDPTTDEVVGSIDVPGCPSLSHTGLVFDAVTGALVDLCGSGAAIVVDPSTGTVLGNLAYGGYSVGPNCAGLSPSALSLAAAPNLGELLVLVDDCFSPANASQPAEVDLSLTVLSEQNYSVLQNVSLGPTEESPIEQFEGTEPMAYDPASSQLYVDWNLSANGTQAVRDVNVSTGTVVRTLYLPLLAPALPMLPLTFLPTPGLLVTEGLVTVGSGFASAIYTINPTSGRLAPAIYLGGYTSCTPGLSLEDCGYDVIPSWLTPDGGADLAIAATDIGDHAFTLVYNLSDDARVANVSTGPAGLGVYDPLARVFFLPDPNDDRLVEFGDPTGEAVASVPLGMIALAEVTDPFSGATYVAAGSECGFDFLPGPCQNESIYVIPPGGTAATFSWPVTAGLVGAMTFDAADQRLFVLTECVATVPGGTLPCLGATGESALTAYSPSGQWLDETLLTDQFQIWVHEPMIVDPVSGGLLALTPAGSSGDALTVFDPNTTAVEGTVTLPHDSSNGALAADVHDGLVLGSTLCLLTGKPTEFADCLWALNASSFDVEWNLTLPVTGSTSDPALAYDASNDTLLLGNSTGVVSIDPATGAVVGQHPFAAGASDLALDGSDGVLYVVNGYNLTELNASTGEPLLRTSLASEADSQLAVDPINGAVVVLEPFAGSVLLVKGTGAAAYPVQFPETGVPAGASWTVTLGAVSQTSTGPVGFFVPNGTYSYAITAPAGYTQTSLPPQGNLTVAGAGQSEPTAAFQPPTYAIAFTVIGQPAGAEFNVTLEQTGGIPFALTCTPCNPGSLYGGGVTFEGPNGTYRYFLSGQPAGWQFDVLSPSGQSQAGTFTVSGGAPYGALVEFRMVPGRTPGLTLHARGLPSGVRWCAALAAVLTACSTSASLRFGDLTPGDYTYSLSAPAGYSIAKGAAGTVNLSSRNLSLTGTFRPVLYPVSLSEIGLLPKTSWKVVVDGKVLSGRRTTFTLELPNGSYAYASSPPRTYSGGAVGELVVNGSAVVQLVGFARVTYNVTLDESGLPAYTTWTVTVAGTSYSSYSSALSLNLTNGTFRVRVERVAGYVAEVLPNPFTVNGAATSLTIEFRPKG